MSPEVIGVYLDRIYDYLEQLGISRENSYKIFLQGSVELLLMNKMPQVEHYSSEDRQKIGIEVLHEFQKTGMRVVNKLTGAEPFKN